MNKRNWFFSLLMVFTLGSVAMTANAQGRGHGDWNRGHSDNRGGYSNHNNGNYNNNQSYARTWHSQGDRWSYNNNNGNWRHHNGWGNNWNRPRVYYGYGPAYRYRPVIVRPMMMPRPRYLFYPDYNVYFDSYRNVYISYTPMGWSFSNIVPYALQNVNVNNIRRYRVNYDGDDFAGYYQNQPPVCDQEYNGN